MMSGGAGDCFQHKIVFSRVLSSAGCCFQPEVVFGRMTKK